MSTSPENRWRAFASANDTNGAFPWARRPTLITWRIFEVRFSEQLIIRVLILQSILMVTTPFAHGVSPPNTELSTPPESQAWIKADFLDVVKGNGSDCALERPGLLRCSGPLQISGLKRTRLQGHNLRVEFLDPRPGRGGIVIRSAVDMELSDIVIDWASGGARDPSLPGTPRLQSFGAVARCAGDSNGGELRMDLPLEGEEPLGAVSVWSEEHGWPWFRAAPNGPEVYFPAGTTANFSQGASGCVPQLSGLIGQRVLVRHYIYSDHAVRCITCTDVTIERVHVTSAPGMAFVFESGSNLTLRSNIVAPACSPHCVRVDPSVSADAAHFTGVGGNILVENNDFGWQGDDALNIAGLMLPARQSVNHTKSGAQLLLEAQSRQDLQFVHVGDKLLLFDRGLSRVGSAEALATDSKAGLLQLSSSATYPSDLLIVDSALIPTSITIRHNYFHDSRARGILLSSGSSALIRANRIARITMEAVLIASNIVEGPGAQRVTVEQNYVADANRYPSTVYPSVISVGIDLEENFRGTAGTPIADVQVKNNTFRNIYTNPGSPVFIGRGVVNGHF
jgi:parallel beta helix pectate lyase-like protein